MDFSILNNWTGPFQPLKVSGVFFYIHSVSNRNDSKQTVDPDQTPRSATSEEAPVAEWFVISPLWVRT